MTDTCYQHITHLYQALQKEIQRLQQRLETTQKYAVSKPAQLEVGLLRLALRERKQRLATLQKLLQNKLSC